MYKLISTKSFDKRYKSLIKNNKKLEEKTLKIFDLLKRNPYNPVLNSHKVITKDYKERWSSKVTGNIRIIWDYYSVEEITLLLLDIGGHSGKHKVYN